MLILYDINTLLCNAWKIKFQKYINCGEVKVLNTSFNDIICDCVVTAGNSYGWMTGGIDLAVREYFGQWVQDTIQKYIIQLPGRYLPVGQFLSMQTSDITKPELLYVPTMDVPKHIDKLDVFYVFSKILLHPCKNIACCGLGTSCGGVNELDCADAMLRAYEYVKGYMDENTTN